MKSGIKTSELWVLVSSVLVTLLISAGIISASAAEEIKTQTQAVIAGVIALTPTVVALWYTVCRTVIKTREQK